MRLRSTRRGHWLRGLAAWTAALTVIVANGGVSQAQAAADPPPETVAATAAQVAEKVDPGFHEPRPAVPAAIPDWQDPESGGWSTYENTSEPVTIGAATAAGTPVTVGGRALTFRECTLAGIQGQAACLTATGQVSRHGKEFVQRNGDSSAGVEQHSATDIRRLVYIGGADAKRRYTYAVDGATFAHGEDGAVEVLDASGKVIGDVQPAWAVDANDVTVPASYEISADGRYLSLIVEHTGAAYPVVADPKISFGWGIYLAAWGWELRAWAIAALAVGGAAYIGTCAASGFLPRILGAIVNAVCILVGVTNVRGFIDAIKTIYRSGALRDGTCYQKKISNRYDKFKAVSASKCR